MILRVRSTLTRRRSTWLWLPVAGVLAVGAFWLVRTKVDGFTFCTVTGAPVIFVSPRLDPDRQQIVLAHERHHEAQMRGRCWRTLLNAQWTEQRMQLEAEAHCAEVPVRIELSRLPAVGPQGVVWRPTVSALHAQQAVASEFVANYRLIRWRFGERRMRAELHGACTRLAL